MQPDCRSVQSLTCVPGAAARAGIMERRTQRGAVVYAERPCEAPGLGAIQSPRPSYISFFGKPLQSSLKPIREALIPRADTPPPGPLGRRRTSPWQPRQREFLPVCTAGVHFRTLPPPETRVGG